MLKEILDYIQQIAKIGLFIALTAWVVNNWNNTLSIYHMGGLDVENSMRDEYKFLVSPPK